MAAKPAKSLSVESTENINIRESLAVLGRNAGNAFADCLAEHGINLDERRQRECKEACSKKLVTDGFPLIHDWLAQKDHYAETLADAHAESQKERDVEIRRLEKAIERADRSAEERLAAKDRVHATEVADLKAEIKRVVSVLNVVRSQVTDD